MMVKSVMEMLLFCVSHSLTPFKLGSSIFLCLVLFPLLAKGLAVALDEPMASNNSDSKANDMFVGEYHFVSSDNFDGFLGALGKSEPFRTHQLPSSLLSRGRILSSKSGLFNKTNFLCEEGRAG